MRFDISDELQRNFKAKCASEGVKMNATLVRLINEWVNESNAKETMQAFLQSLMEGTRPSNADIVETARLLDLDTRQLLDFCDRVLGN